MSVSVKQTYIQGTPLLSRHQRESCWCPPHTGFTVIQPCRTIKLSSLLILFSLIAQTYLTLVWYM